MKLTVDPQATDVWVRRIRTYEGEQAYRQLIDQLRARPSKARDLLDHLAEVRDPIVRAWAGTAAKEVFGHEAIPLLVRLIKDRDPDVRDVARQDLVALDPAFERTFFPAYRRTLKRRKDTWGEDMVAMFTLARARDEEAVGLLREYATHHEARYWHHRMPLVLADYIEDPDSVTRRIRSHDHDFMFWLVDATTVLNIPDAKEAMEEALAQPIDDACAAILRERLPRLE